MRAEKGKFRISKSIRILIVCMLVSASLLGGFFVVAQPGHDRYGPTDEPPKTDTDGDGVPDYRDSDDDNDGLTDKYENQLGTDPKRADSDGDMVSDPDEFIDYTDPNDDDTDNDGWSDGAEKERETVPQDPESRPGKTYIPEYEPDDDE